MRVLLNNDIKVGSNIFGQFKILPNLGNFYVKGEVLWVKPQNPKLKSAAFEVGIKFAKINTIPF